MIYFIIAWLAVGRSGESGNCSWTCCRWDFEYEMLFMDWGEEKKADHKLMNFCGDAEEFRICFNLVMALYMVFGGADNRVNVMAYFLKIMDYFILVCVCLQLY